ncbi:MAG: Hsp20/alpha crystallin family protein [Deltaproteobacteria bacterium]|nr:Hsp20/alpha crystallin family protein [Kofleriaceae bacterium]
MLREMGGMPALSSPDQVLDRLERTLTPMWSWTPRPAARWPVFDVAHTDDAIVITADVPGLGDDDVNVHVAGRLLTIEGKTSRRGYEGAFQRQFTLAEGLDLDHIEAQLERGVLTVLVPKTPRARPRQIKLGSGVVDKVKGLLGLEAGRSEDKTS